MQEVLATIAPHEKIPVKEHLSLVFVSSGIWVKPEARTRQQVRVSKQGS